jgi:CRISPR-associated protein Csn2
MKLVNAQYDLKIKFDENMFYTLVVEAPFYFSDIIHQLVCQSEGQEGDFVLSVDNEIIRIDKNLSVLVDPFRIELNNRKVLHKIYCEMEKIAQDEIEMKGEINSYSSLLLERVINKTLYDHIVFNFDFEWNDFFKMYHVSIDGTELTLEEKLAEYIKILTQVLNQKILCVVNGHDFYPQTTLKYLVELAEYQKLNILFIEAREHEQIDGERVTIIDKDRCLIMK